ncbi:MAG: phage protein Gp27 family protein [Pseudomonadota bacterium]
MPPVSKIDRLPAEIRADLDAALAKAGFGDIVAITGALNEWLDAADIDLSVGKSAVGKYAKVKKQQMQAIELTEAVLDGTDVERESQAHATLVHMLSNNALDFMKGIADEEKSLDPKQFSSMAKFAKDLMSSSGIRERLRADEEARIAQRAKEEAVEDVTASSNELGLSPATIELIRGKILGKAA